MDLRLPPMLLAALLGLLAWGVDAGAPVQDFRELPAQGLLAATLAGAGAGVMLAGALALRLAQTTLDPRYPLRATRLVAGGIYRFTRNPIYLGALAVLAGWVVYLGQPLGLAILPFWVWYITRFQIRPEESAMRERFGAAWVVYCARVRRWL
ncbi:MAG: methyltransferase family protein [Gammaproteobacteria bacterium]